MTKQEQSLKDKTAKGLFWGGLSNGIQQLLGITFGIALGRILDAEDYGLVGMLTIFIAISGTIMDGGFVNALINKKNVTHEDYNAVFWFSSISGVVIYTVLFFCAPLIAQFYDNPKLINLSRVVLFCIFTGGLSVVHNAIILKEMQLKNKAKIDLISLLLASITGLTFALSGFAYWALVIQTLVYSSLLTILRWYYTPWRPTFHFNFNPIGKMLSFSSKLFITNIFQQVSSNIFSVFLGRFYNERQVGFYSQGQKWMSMGQSIAGTTISGVAQPVLVQVIENKDRQRHILRKMIRFGAFISFPLMFGIAFIGEELIVITVGEKWLEAVPFLQLFCIWGAFRYIWILYTNLFISHGKSNINMYGTIATCIVQILCVLLMIPFGVFPMVIVYLAVNFVTLIGWHYFIKRLIGLKYVDIIKDITPFLVITSVVIAIAWFITKDITNNYILISLKIIIVACLYLIIMWKSKARVFNDCIQFILKRKKQTE